MLCLSYFATQCVVWLSSQTCLMEVWMKGFAFISFAFRRASKSIFMSDPFTQVFGFNANDKLMTWGKSKLFVDIQHHASHNHKWGFVPFGHLISKWTLEFPFPFLPTFENNTLQLLQWPVHTTTLLPLYEQDTPVTGRRPPWSDSSDWYWLASFAFHLFSRLTRHR